MKKYKLYGERLTPQIKCINLFTRTRERSRQPVPINTEKKWKSGVRSLGCG